jgi:hypothetical protein
MSIIRSAYVGLLASLAAVTMAVAPASAQQQQQKPNILVIMATWCVTQISRVRFSRLLRNARLMLISPNVLTGPEINTVLPRWRDVSSWQILLQKSFCTRDQNFFWLYTRISCKDLGDLIA